MQRPSQTFDSRTHHNGVKPLPLFRPEALANQQQKSYGEIILIRPLSLVVLTWLAIAIVASSVGFLALGHYTEKVRLSGSMLPAPGSAANSVGANLQAELYVPSRWLRQVQPGTRLSLHCQGCPPQFAEQVGTVSGISDAPLDPSNSSSAGTTLLERKYKVTVSLPPQAAQLLELSHTPQTGLGVEAEIPLGRKPLIKWFFERSGS
jgi:hypothetical protein